MDDAGVLQIPIELRDHRLHLGASCAGATMEFAMSGMDCVLTFPEMELGKNGGDSFFPVFKDAALRPGVLEEEGWGLHAFGFGSRTLKSGGNIELVEFVVEKLLVTIRTTNIPDNMANLICDIERIISRMVTWLEIIAFEDFSYNPGRSYGDRSMNPYFIDSSGNAQRVKDYIGVITHNIWIREEDPPNADTVRQALSLATEGREIDLIHQLLSSSLKHLIRENNRGAVLDAATSMELALARILETYVSASGIALGQKYMSQFRSAGKLRAAIEILSGTHPVPQGQLERMISIPRNNAIHRGESVTDAEAWGAVGFAKEFVYSKFPPVESN